MRPWIVFAYQTAPKELDISHGLIYRIHTSDRESFFAYEEAPKELDISHGLIYRIHT
jgi:membrane protein YdbS with pleckstrin-like domain